MLMIELIPKITFHSRHHCPGVPYIIVGLKMDLREDKATLELLEKKGMAPIAFEQVTSFIPADFIVSRA